MWIDLIILLLWYSSNFTIEYTILHNTNNCNNYHGKPKIKLLQQNFLDYCQLFSMYPNESFCAIKWSVSHPTQWKFWRQVVCRSLYFQTFLICPDDRHVVQILFNERKINMKKLVVHTVWTETAELSQVAESDWLRIDAVFPSSLSEVSFGDFKPQEETITSLSRWAVYLLLFITIFCRLRKLQNIWKL